MRAIYFGTFAPLHKGHSFLIINAKRKYGCVEIICSGYENDRGDLAGISLVDRYRTIREIFKDDELVQVHKLDETKIARYPDGWTEWLSEIKKLVGDFEGCVFICSEKEYQDELIKRGYHVDIGDRSVVPISGTEIRTNPYDNWDYINKYFKKFFTNRILIYGTASTGKTTLTKDLANYYNTSYSLEYAREYQEKYNVLDDELDIRDLTNIGIGQFNQNKAHIMSPACNKIFFADTDVMTTLNYLEYYNSEEEEYAAVSSIFNGLIAKQKWELILFLQPDTEYVNDGFRDMGHSDQEFRRKFNDIFRQKLLDNNLTYIELAGSFTDKFNAAVMCCDELLSSDFDEYHKK